MPTGAEMQIVGQGQDNLLLNGNPSFSFFKAGYKHYTNFAMQKFRIDFEGSKMLRLTEPSQMVFKIPRYADMLMNAYLSINLPHIWSPIMPPSDSTGNQWAPYEFKWIENIGAKMIHKVSVGCGSYVLQEFSGDYLLASMQRDSSSKKNELFNEMIGQVPEIMDPGNSNARVNAYPNAYYTSNPAGPEPSIHGRTLMVPLNCWFGLRSEMAFPLVSLQYNELTITITFRPINELFRIRDVLDIENNYPYVAPNFTNWHMQLQRFLNPPPDIELTLDSYPTTATAVWNTDVHLTCTYAFLDESERQVFATQPKTYLMKQPHETIFYNVTGSQKVQISSIAAAATNWIFYFQRSDANLRNEWSNYTNWPYGYMPLNIMPAQSDGTYSVTRYTSTGEAQQVLIGPGVNPDGSPTGFFINQVYSPQNTRLILANMAILFNGEYRENMQTAPVYNLVEKYTQTTGNAPPGLYLYNWSINSNNSDLQPSGAVNLGRFLRVELELNTILPPNNPHAQSLVICDPETQEVIGVNKPYWRVFEYNFDLHFFEERLNWLTIEGGNVGVKYAN